MKLHRTTGKPDWTAIPAVQHTRFQRLAAFTGGILTPANVITVTGLIIILIGLGLILQARYEAGMVLLVIGRLLDVADGVVADKTGTKAPLGEALDAGVDKIVTFLTIISFYVAHVAHWSVITVLILPQVITLGIIFYLHRIGKAVHPTRIGKLSMAMLWISIIGLLALQVWKFPLVTVCTAITIGLSIVFGVIANWQYATGRD